MNDWESMKLLIDTNVILDVLLRRGPFDEPAVKVLSLTRREDIQEYISASAVTDTYYIANRQMKDSSAVKDLLKRLLTVVSIAAVSEQEIQNALCLPWADFEDAVQYSVALLNKMDGIITRNPKDYQTASVRVWLPEEALEALASSGQGR